MALWSHQDTDVNLLSRVTVLSNKLLALAAVKLLNWDQAVLECACQWLRDLLGICLLKLLMEVFRAKIVLRVSLTARQERSYLVVAVQTRAVPLNTILRVKYRTSRQTTCLDRSYKISKKQSKCTTQSIGWKCWNKKRAQNMYGKPF